MPDEITTDVKEPDEAAPSLPTPPADPALEDHEDPSSKKELEGMASEPDVDVKPEDVAGKDDGKALDEAVATEAEGAEDPSPLEPATPSVEPSSTGKSEPSSTAGSDGATGASAPAAEPSESSDASTSSPTLGSPPETDGKAPEKAPDEASAAPAWEGPYDGLHESAKAIEGFLGDDRLEDLKDAGNALFHVAEDLIEKDVSKLDPEPAAILANVRNHGAGFLAALEAVFKRTR